MAHIAVSNETAETPTFRASWYIIKGVYYGVPAILSSVESLALCSDVLKCRKFHR